MAAVAFYLMAEIGQGAQDIFGRPLCALPWPLLEEILYLFEGEVPYRLGTLQGMELNLRFQKDGA